MPGYDGWYNDFWELSTDRQFGMAVGPMPRSSIIEHTRGWPDDEADAFRTIMRRMDDVFRNFKPPKVNPAMVDDGLSPQERLKRIFGDRIN